MRKSAEQVFSRPILAATLPMLMEIIDKDLDIDVEVKTRRIIMDRLPANPSNSLLDFNGTKLRIRLLTPLFYSFLVRKLSAFRYFIALSSRCCVGVAMPATDLTIEYSETGHTLLHLAVMARVPEFVHTILSYGIAYYPDLVNKPLKDQSGNTPLHLAVMSKNEEILLDLLKYGADPLLKNANGELPVYLDIVNEKGMSRFLFQRMMALNGNVSRKMIQSPTRTRADIIKLFNPEDCVIEPDPNPRRRCSKGTRECSVPTCIDGRKVRMCHRCKRCYCAFHIERHCHVESDGNHKVEVDSKVEHPLNFQREDIKL